MKSHSKNQTSEHLAITRHYTFFAFLSGLRYPTPHWFDAVPSYWRKLWRSYFLTVECLFLGLLTSCLVLLALEGPTRIGVRTECVGSISLLIYSCFKSWCLYKNKVLMSKVVRDLHRVGDELLQNPMRNDCYLYLHHRHFSKLQHYCVSKFVIVVGSAMFLYMGHLGSGLMTDDPSQRIPPMLGWFPLDFSSRFQFFVACTAQIMCYSTLLARDVAADIVIITVMAVVNNQLLFLAALLGDIVEAGPVHTPKQRRQILGWWIRQHQHVITIFNDFKNIGSPLLCATYGYVSVIFFLALLRLTVDTEFVMEQQIVVVGINVGNMLHLYIISALGDDIANNSMRISLELNRGDLWVRGSQQLKAVKFIAARCAKPVRLVFADNRPLAVTSFADIMTSLMSYFVTIYQLRN